MRSAVFFFASMQSFWLIATCSIQCAPLIINLFRRAFAGRRSLGLGMKFNLRKNKLLNNCLEQTKVILRVGPSEVAILSREDRMSQSEYYLSYASGKRLRNRRLTTVATFCQWYFPLRCSAISFVPADLATDPGVFDDFCCRSKAVPDRVMHYFLLLYLLSIVWLKEREESLLLDHNIFSSL